MKVRIKGVEGYIKKMGARYTYSESLGCKPHLGKICSYTITIIQNDLTEIKFSGVQPSEIDILQ